MAVESLNPYLHYNGNAAEAIQLYEQALGAKVNGVMHYSDMPGQTFSDEHKQRVMHANLSIGSSALMLADDMPNAPSPASNGQVLVNFTDGDSMVKSFHEMASGGTVVLALHNTFWGARFGIVVDRFGISWAFHGPKMEA